MRLQSVILLFWSLLLVFANSASAKDLPPAAPNGVELPKYYRNWRVIGVSHRTDNNSLRVIVGNPIAIQAADSGDTSPWPDGAVLGKLVWKDRSHPDFPAATVPDSLSHVEFMVKDAAKYRATGGWGYGRWLGKERIPYGDNAQFDRECANCHQAAEATDFVFTRPVEIP